MRWGVRKKRVSTGGHPSSAHPSTSHPSKGSSTLLPKKTKQSMSSPTTSPLRNFVTSGFKKRAMMARYGIVGVKGKYGTTLTNLMGGRDRNADIVFRKGSVVQHVMTTPTKDLNRHLFVAADDADKANYAGFFAALTKYRFKADQMYRMELTAKDALVSPGKKKRVDEFIKLYEKDKVNISRELAEFNKREYGGYFKDPVEKYAKQYENMPLSKLRSEGYYTFFNSLFSSDYNREKYFNQLKKQGYNAVVDDNDKRSFMQAKAPLIVFNAYDSLEQKRVSDLSMDEIKENMRKWVKMEHMDQDVDDYLMHYGVKGMKWGVRKKYVPKGRQKSRFTKPIRSLIDSLSTEQRNYIGDGYWIDKDRTVYRNVVGNSKRIDGFLDVYNLPKEHHGEGTVVLAVSNKQAGKGYATKLAKQMVSDYESGRFGSDLSNLIWRVDEGNTASDKVAKNAGFVYEGTEEEYGEKLNVYRYYRKRR